MNKVLAGEKKIKQDPEYETDVQQIGPVREHYEPMVYPKKRTGESKKRF